MPTSIGIRIYIKCKQAHRDSEKRKADEWPHRGWMGRDDARKRESAAAIFVPRVNCLRVYFIYTTQTHTSERVRELWRKSRNCRVTIRYSIISYIRKLLCQMRALSRYLFCCASAEKIWWRFAWKFCRLFFSSSVFHIFRKNCIWCILLWSILMLCNCWTFF